jgi:hypothetical protein
MEEDGDLYQGPVYLSVPFLPVTPETSFPDLAAQIPNVAEVKSLCCILEGLQPP